MNDTERFVVVRELYPETKGSFFKSKKCPPIDDSREFAYGMDDSGKVVRLADERVRDDAARKGNRIFAVSKKHVDFSNVFLHVCREDGYEWNYAMEGVLKISDASKFLPTWACDEGSCGLDGIDSDRFTHRVLSRLESIVKDRIKDCRKTHGYHIADIQEKDALPSHFWTAAFANAGDLMLAGLGIEVTDKAFLSPDMEVEAKINAAAAAQRELENQAKAEWQAVVNGKMAEAELEEMERQRKRREKEFALEMARKDAEIKKCQAETLQFQNGNLKLDIETIKVAIQAASDNATRVADLEAALSEAVAKIKSNEDKLAKLGVDAVNSSESRLNIDPAVAPRYQGMSDSFLDVMEKIKSKASNAVVLTYQVRDRHRGFATRAIISDICTARTLGRIGDGLAPEHSAALRIGDGITIRLKSERSGYLTLINFGTTRGVVNKIFPDPYHGALTRRIEAGRHYMMPGDLIPCPPGCEYWPVTGATTAQYGLKERVLAIVTDDEIDIDVSSFVANVGSAMTRGGFVAVEESITSFMDLPDGTWSWGLLEAVVED